MPSTSPIATPPLPWDGRCRCGQVTLSVTEAPLLTSACHCTGCQRMTASAFSLTLTVPSSGFAVSSGETVIGGLHGPQAHHFFCPHCKSWLFTRAEGFDWLVNVRATMLDDPRWFAPFIEVWTRERISWARTPAVHSFETEPPFGDYERLIGEFARVLSVGTRTTTESFDC